MGKTMTRAGTVHVRGPLAPFAATFKAELEASGYTPLSTASVMRVVAHLSHWLEGEAMDVADMSRERIEQYIRARCRDGYVTPPPGRALVVLLGVLEAAGAVAVSQPTMPVSAADALLASFGDYLLDERALAPSTASAYVERARRFLAGRPGAKRLDTLNTRDITDAVLRESAAGSIGATQYFVAGLRSFLRFCFVEGLIPTDLSAAALTATGRRSSTLPRGISRADADALLVSCDRRRADGRRDYAIVLTLLRLGLRSSEVAALRLDDIDWRAGLVVVHGKGRREDTLPLPDDVGSAIAGYLQRGRPKTDQREIFLRTLAPIEALGRGGVSSVVRRACTRAGIPPFGSHRLRHTLACEMVAAGVPLPEIAQTLRHRSLSSSAIYARVDLDRLGTLAQPWPGSAQ